MGLSVLNWEVEFELALFLFGFFFSTLIVDSSKSVALTTIMNIGNLSEPRGGICTPGSKVGAADSKLEWFIFRSVFL